MPAWLDLAIVALALMLAVALVRYIYRRGEACTKACGPTRNDLVQIGRKDRPFLAGSRGNR